MAVLCLRKDNYGLYSIDGFLTDGLTGEGFKGPARRSMFLCRFVLAQELQTSGSMGSMHVGCKMLQVSLTVLLNSHVA